MAEILIDHAEKRSGSARPSADWNAKARQTYWCRSGDNQLPRDPLVPRAWKTQDGGVQSPLSDDELTSRWESQELGGSGVSHIDHVRVAWVLHRRHGALEAEERLVEGTRKGCEHYSVPEKFDEHLTRLWARAVSTAVDDAPKSETFEEFIARNPQLRRGDLYGKPQEPH